MSIDTIATGKDDGKKGFFFSIISTKNINTVPIYERMIIKDKYFEKTKHMNVK